ncbi:MAG TPA: hypothetical protein VGY56_04070 [Verrucomicrobiae bacterium]|nr:hypothetical protein [Verrucomicrobiae bacterium]
MAWPMPQDYSEAVQNPHLAFSDADLKRGQIELNNLGLPRPCAGAFAVVFKVKVHPQSWAVKCFTSEILDQQRRYEAISTYLAKVALPYTVPFTYMQSGIKVSGNNYPLLKMEWVQGESLGSFVGRSLNYPDTLLSLAKVLLRMMADLKAASIAHGDLQNGNILVVGDQLKLIDYDGMFVPALNRQQSNEIGHRNFQLPTRSKWDFGPYLDNFSAWVIYVSLVALAVHPELWDAHQGGDECLIFRKDDFVNPAGSALLRDLNASPNSELRLLCDMFASFFSLSPQDIPFLDGNLPNVKIEAPRQWWQDEVEQPAKEEKQQPEASRAAKEEPVVSDPGWIIDSLVADKPIERIGFQGHPEELRIVVFGSFALAVLVAFFIDIPPSELFVTVSCVAGLNVLLCFIRYRSDPSHVEFKEFKDEAKTFLRQVHEHQTVLDSISAERAALQEDLAKTEGELVEQKNRLSANLQAELGKLQNDWDFQMQSINKRRQEAQVAESNKLSSLQASLGDRIVELDRKIRNLHQAESDEKQQKTNEFQELHIQSRLRSRAIANSSISGIGASYKARLRIAGINTAADIDWRVRSVHGIGPTRQAVLFAWRQGLEQDARRSAPVLSDSVRGAIENKYRGERRTHEITRLKLQTEFDAQVSSARQYFADVRQSLNQEEKQVRVRATNEKAHVQQDYAARLSEVDARVVAARNQAAPAMSDLTEKWRTAQKQVFAMRWKSEKHKRQGLRFETLRFKGYLFKIVSL